MMMKKELRFLELQIRQKCCILTAGLLVALYRGTESHRSQSQTAEQCSIGLYRRKARTFYARLNTHVTYSPTTCDRSTHSAAWFYVINTVMSVLA